MTPKQIIRTAINARKAANKAVALAAELDAAVHVYWKRKGAPSPRWFSMEMRRQAEGVAGMAHSMELWAQEELSPTNKGVAE